MARANGTYRDYMKKLRKEKLLILDEWLLYPLKEAEARDVLELVEARNKVASTIFCSQYDTSEWHENLYDPTLADASVTGSSTTPIPSRLRAIHAQAQGIPEYSPHGGPAPPRPRPPCTISAEAVHHSGGGDAPSSAVKLYFLGGVCSCHAPFRSTGVGPAVRVSVLRGHGVGLPTVMV